MKRSGPIRRDTEKSREWANKRTRLKPRSSKRSNFMKDVRIPMIEELVEAGARCEIGPVLIKTGLSGGTNCRGRIEGLHELRKRSAGGSLVNPDNLVPACNPCNTWVEDNPDDAHVLGLVLRDGDEGYEELGARHDDDPPTEGSQGE